MTHSPGGFWNPDCERCRTITVGELDDNHFAELMGVTRTEFEDYCIPHGLPVKLPGLYNFWYAIMEARALPIYFRKQEIAERSRRPAQPA
jgi:hypothetical protein